MRFYTSFAVGLVGAKSVCTSKMEFDQLMKGLIWRDCLWWQKNGPNDPGGPFPDIYFLLVRGLPAQWGERTDNSRPCVKFWCIFWVLSRTAGKPGFQSMCTSGTATVLWKQTSNMIFSTPYEQTQLPSKSGFLLKWEKETPFFSTNHQ